MTLSRMCTPIFTLLLSLVLMTSYALALDGQAVFTWSVPTKRVNGDPLPLNEIASYRIYSSRVAGELLQDADPTTALNLVVTMPSATTTEHTATFDVTDGETLYFAMTTVDTDGIEGNLSNILSKQFVVPKEEPEAPILRSVTVKFLVIQ